MADSVPENKTTAEIMAESSPKKETTEITEESLPEMRAEENVAESLPEKDNTENVAEPCPEKGTTENVPESCPEKGTTEHAAESLPEKNTETEVTSTVAGAPSPVQSEGSEAGSITERRRSLGVKKHEELTDELRLMYAKPFEQGWAREVVKRGTGSGADIYYFTPEGRKLRSRVEIEKYLVKLEKTNLTTDNFTFRKLRVYHDPKEIVRCVNESNRRRTDEKLAIKLAKATTSAEKTPSTPKPLGQIMPKSAPKSTPKNASKITPKSALKSTPKSSNRNSKPDFKPSPLPIAPAPPAGASPVFLSLKKSEPALAQLPTKHRLTPTARKHMGSTMAVAKKQTGTKRKASSPHGLTPKFRRTEDEIDYSALLSTGPMANLPTSPDLSRSPSPPNAPLQRLCNLSCPLANGQLMSLHCEICMCLFHPICLGYPPDYCSIFKCKSCNNGTLDPPPPILGGATSIVTTQNLLPTNPSMVRLRLNTDTSLSMGSRIVLPASTQPSMVSPEAPPMTSPGTHLVRVTVPNTGDLRGQVITLPPHLSSKLNFSKPLVFKLAGINYHVPPDCVSVQTDEVKVFLPSRDAAVAALKAGPIAMHSSVTNGNQEITAVSMPTDLTDMENALQGKDAPPPQQQQQQVAMNGGQTDAGNKTNGASRGKRYKDNRYTNCPMQKLQGGLDCLILIFQHLPLADLTRAAQVCRSFMFAARCSVLWRVVRLKGVWVKDWQRAVDAFNYNHTNKLDLRKLCHVNNDCNRTWHDLHGMLEKMREVRELEFGDCPPTILHAVTAAMPQLEYLAAECIGEANSSPDRVVISKLDIGLFSKLKNLQTLKLRGKQGLTLPAISFSEMSELKHLTNLRVLVMTTLKEVSEEEFAFLGALTQLERLEIGSVKCWGPQTYNLLQNLKNLKALHLQCGGDMRVQSHLGQALETLKELRELQLTKFIVSSQLSQHLQNLRWLEELFIWPDIDHQASSVNTNTLTAVCKMTSLKQVQWGIMNNSDSVSFCLDPPSTEITVDKMSINDLGKLVSEKLPNAKIRVFNIPYTNMF